MIRPSGIDPLADHNFSMIPTGLGDVSQAQQFAGDDHRHRQADQPEHPAESRRDVSGLGERQRPRCREAYQRRTHKEAPWNGHGGRHGRRSGDGDRPHKVYPTVRSRAGRSSPTTVLGIYSLPRLIIDRNPFGLAVEMIETGQVAGAVSLTGVGHVRNVEA